MKKQLINSLVFPLLFLPIIISAQNNSSDYDIVWTNITGCSVVGNTITKDIGSGWNAGASSENTLAAGEDGWVEMSFTIPGKVIYFGFSDQHLDHLPNNKDYAVANWGNTLYFYENGISMGTFGAIATTDVIRLERTGSTISLLKNGEIKYTSTTSSTTSLIVDLLIYTTEGAIVDPKASFPASGQDPIDPIDPPTAGNSYFVPDDNPNDVNIRYSDGKVVIGADDIQKPGEYNLYVSKGILTELVTIAVKNDPNSWADYVFDNNYPLRSLNDLKVYIDTHKHLPEIPSTKEVIDQGINVAAMQAKLLQKIEELTLYIIKQQEEIELLKKRQDNDH